MSPVEPGKGRRVVTLFFIGGLLVVVLLDHLVIKRLEAALRGRADAGRDGGRGGEG